LHAYGGIGKVLPLAEGIVKQHHQWQKQRERAEAKAKVGILKQEEAKAKARARERQKFKGLPPTHLAMYGCKRLFAG
jgi:hypothetical protein